MDLEGRKQKRKMDGKEDRSGKWREVEIGRRQAEKRSRKGKR